MDPERSGFIVRVFDGNLSQSKEEAFEKYCNKQRNLQRAKLNEKISHSRRRGIFKLNKTDAFKKLTEQMEHPATINFNPLLTQEGKDDSKPDLN